ncbi:TonB-dependent siderophore receptor [Apibacter sp. ESL0404]|uniref:TonB-dependent receptor plug domain-containing protein n=1 Tax=Apibacter sp. ESL0404 TaxID=2704651 RepID=UPI001C6A3653|nr:TonB-dependent receptor [Apibacter sp. ESL0404]QYN51316.1 TonB-dependent receptor [Apibacter sp. ESL0404]
MKLFYSIIALFICLVLVAQESKELEGVVIQGKTLSLPYNKTSQDVQIITKEQIKAMPASSIEEVLSYYSGIDIRQRGAHGVQADVSIRGSSFEQVLILINGIRMNDSQTGHNTMNLPLDLASIERIEIVKGPAARRFGQNAYAGAINIVTRPSTKNDITISGSLGDFNTTSLGASLNVSGKKFSHFIQAETSQSDGYRYNTDYQVKNVWYQNQYKLNGGELRLQGGFIDKKFGANGFYSSPLAKDQYEAIQTSMVSIGWNQKSGKFKWESNAYWRWSQDEYIFERHNPSKYRNLHIGNNAGIEVNTNYSSSLGITGVGLDFRKEYLSSNNLGKNHRTVYFAFLEHRFMFFKNRLDITPGISFSDYSDFGNFWYPGIDIGYSINQQNKLFANLGKTYRVPTYTDLNYTDPVTEGNSNLKPENALSYELGYRLNHKNIKTTISFFRRESRKSIDWKKDSEEGKWKPENISRINTDGVEVDFNYSFTALFIKSINLGYTYLDKNLKYSDRAYSRYSLDNLRHQLVVKVEHKLFKNISNQIIYRYNDRVNLDDYHLLDDRLMYQTNNLQLYIQMTNILNTKYTESNLVPMPGRWIQGGVVFKNFL